MAIWSIHLQKIMKLLPWNIAQCGKIGCKLLAVRLMSKSLSSIYGINQINLKVTQPAIVP